LTSQINGGQPPDAGDIRAQIEDHALTAVPESDRRSGWGLMMNTAGIVLP
jgi:cytosine permease